MSVSTDEMYNAESRYLHKMYRIHFSANKTLDVTKSDYLMSSSILEETQKASSTPFGEVVSSELTITLVNSNEMFNPKNTSGPYYDYIRRGIKIEAFIRPDEVDEWDPIGVFYVANWSTLSSGMTAEVTAYDALYSVLNAPVPSLPISRNIAFSDFMIEYFKLFGIDINVDDAIDFVLPYGFTSGYTDNRKLLTDLMTAAIADCFCSHDGKVNIRSKTAERDLRATFKDDNQIISVAVTQSLTADYDSAIVLCNALQESAEQSVLSIKDLHITPGTFNVERTNFSVDKVVSVRSIKVVSDASVKPVKFNATADFIQCSLQSASETDVSIDIIGKALDTVSSVVSTEGSSSIEIESSFIQTLEAANAVCDYADRYVKADTPELNLTIRGNPKLSLGDKIEVDSTRYKLRYVGLLTRVQYNYSGSLSCEATLTNVAIEEV